jgi:hypothetical protein
MCFTIVHKKDAIDHYVHRIFTLYERYVPLRQRIHFPLDKRDLYVYIVAGSNERGCANALAILHEKLLL